jgi:hypothetical protein
MIKFLPLRILELINYDLPTINKNNKNSHNIHL